MDDDRTNWSFWVGLASIVVLAVLAKDRLDSPLLIVAILFVYGLALAAIGVIGMLLASIREFPANMRKGWRSLAELYDSNYVREPQGKPTTGTLVVIVQKILFV